MVHKIEPIYFLQALHKHKSKLLADTIKKETWSIQCPEDQTSRICRINTIHYFWYLHLTEISGLKADIVNLMDNILFIVNTTMSFIGAISYSDPQGSNSIEKR